MAPPRGTNGNGLLLPRLAQTAAFALSNLIKLAGLVVVLNEILVHGTARADVLAEAAFMMAGARLSERVVMAALDRILGQPQPHDPESHDGRG